MSGNILEALQDGNGATFWVATAAVAAGLTAIVVSALLGARRWRRGARTAAGNSGRAGGWRAVLRRPARRERAEPAPAPLRAAGLRAYEAAAGSGTAAAAPFPAGETGALPEGVEPGSGGGAVRLSPLVGRLRDAAARLEDYAAWSGNAGPAAAAQTPLKPEASGVEYVYRADA